jgi:cell division protein FtsI (penicillin-binding protein 3)
MSLTSRACIACYGFAALFTGLSARLVYIAVNDHDYYVERGRKAYQRKVTLTARRGSILDAKGAVLARNEPQRNVIADGTLLVYEKKDGKTMTQVDDRPKVAKILSGPLGLTEAEIIDKIKPTTAYVVLKNKISEETAGQIEEKLGDKYKGIHFEPNFERVYPEGQMLCHVVGFFGYEEFKGPDGKPTGRFKGIEGIERSMDDWLAGQDGWRCFEKDGRGKEVVTYRTEDRPARDGNNVELTIDLGLQQIMEAELDKAYKQFNPIKCSAVMVNPNTGEVLAMANRPCFNPNEPGDAKPEQRFNHAVAGVYEPGSTMKVVTCSGGINFGKVKLNSEIYCENGHWSYGGKPLADHAAYGNLTVAQIIEKSSNIGAAKIAISLGEETFHGWLRKYGFGQPTGIALPGESRGILHPRSAWSGISITRIAMGQEVCVTPLQMVLAASVIANGGHLMMPQILKRITDQSGKVVRTYEPQEVRTVLSPSVAADLREAMMRVTGAAGTAKRAFIAGYRIAGKTGTTQKYDPDNGGRPSRTKHVTSFVGFVPADKPAFCLIIVMDEAKMPSANEDTGGMVVAPIFKAIAEKSLIYLGVPPDPVLLQQDLAAQKKLANQ